MFVIFGYSIQGKLYEGHNSRIYRAVCQQDQKPVVIKVSLDEYPSVQTNEGFEQEFWIGKLCEEATAVRKYLSIEKIAHNTALILEDFGAVPLLDIITTQGLEIKVFLKIALQLVTGLEELHGKNITHRCINPHNILINKETLQVKIGDLSYATTLSQHTIQPFRPVEFKEEVPYISPEQTGRMNRVLDYRSDFFSLGVTLYQLLLGRLPLEAESPLELLHQITSRAPKPPVEFDIPVPRLISDLLIKLMAKNAEDRHESAYGLKRDLLKCLELLESQNSIPIFPLGVDDICDHFHISQKIYDRFHESTTLMDAFESASEGHKQITMVEGVTGVGKTAVVLELPKLVARYKGFYVTGKYKKMRNPSPYSGFIQVFQNLLDRMFTQPRSEILQTWRARLLAALSGNGQILVHLIPEIEKLIGPQPALTELPPIENQFRFLMTLRNFIHVFAQKEHPLVIFLDQLQWADVSSLSFMKTLALDNEITHLLFIGSYDSGEISSDHPLVTTLAAIEKQRPVCTLHIHELPQLEVQNLLAETFHCKPKVVQQLAEVTHVKSKGNPYYIHQFLGWLYKEKYFRYNYSTRSWEWNAEDIRSSTQTDGIISLLLTKVKKLPKYTQLLLAKASVLGDTFHISLLAKLAGKPVAIIRKELQSAVEDCLILSHKVTDDCVEKHPRENIWRFAHHRIQQAFSLLITKEEILALFLEIGRIKMEDQTKQPSDVEVYDVVSYFHESKELITDKMEAVKVAFLAARAAKKAKEEVAYESSLKYIQLSFDLLPPEFKEEQYFLLADLLKMRATAYFILGDYQRSKETCTQLQQMARNVWDKLDCYYIILAELELQSKHSEMLEVGFEALKLLGLDFPTSTSKQEEQLKETLSRIQKSLSYRPVVAGLIQVPPILDPIPRAFWSFKSCLHFS